jgi:transcriptional regulator with XRE-family HTH domain
VTAAAVPPRLLDTIASNTPIPSPNAASYPAAAMRGMIVADIIAATTCEVVVNSEGGFAAQLRWWRQHRGWSQLELAGRAGISQRHLSFLELGRASPSRDMVLRLAAALDLPLRQHNGLLVAAGFAPVWRETDLDAPELRGIRDAIDHMLAQQEPFPAVAVDRRWNLLKANRGAVRLVEFLVGPLPPAAPVNLADALVGPDVLRTCLVNWPEVVRYFIRSVEADATADGTAATAALLDRLLSYEGVRPLLKAPAANPAAAPVLAMHFRKDAVSLELFTTIATLGTPQDVTLEELRIESFFPMNAETAAIFRGWAAGS